MTDPSLNSTNPKNKDPDTASRANAVEVFVTFLKLGLTSFGGPIAHLGYFRRELVERRAWINDNQYAQLLAICQFLPGPASSQMVFALGMLRTGWVGAIAASTAFTLPSALLLMIFASILPLLTGTVSQGAIHGLKLVPCAVVADAVLGMSKKLCPDSTRRSIAVLAAVALLLAGSTWMQLLVVFIGGAAGLLLCRQNTVEEVGHLPLSYGKPLGLTLLTLFLLLLALLPVLAQQQSSLSAIANVFYQAGALVFGGGHVLLPLLEQSVVGRGWVGEAEFLAGYGAAQAIPGPMFTFAAYLGALTPTAHASWVSASVALLFMFLPGILLLAAALPLWQSVAHRPGAASAIAGVNAAVVGILAAALYDPIFISAVSSSYDMAVVCIGFSLLSFWKRSALWVVSWCVLASIAGSLW